MISFSLVFSLLSLAVSSYALYRGGPVGPKGDIGDTGPRGLPGRDFEAPIVSKPVEPVRSAPPADTRPKFLSREDRREQIAAQAYDDDYQTRLIEIRERLHKESGLIAPDPEAQTGQMPDWRRRNQR